MTFQLQDPTQIFQDLAHITIENPADERHVNNLIEDWLKTNRIADSSLKWLIALKNRRGKRFPTP